MVWDLMDYSLMLLTKGYGVSDDAARELMSEWVAGDDPLGEKLTGDAVDLSFVCSAVTISLQRLETVAA